MRKPSRIFDHAQEVARRRALLEKLHSPRLAMALIAALTAAGGFLASWVLLRLGMTGMVLRYPLAVGLAYLLFLLLLWCWLHWTREEASEASLDITDSATDFTISHADSPGLSLHDSRANPANDSSAPGLDLDIGDGEGAVIGLVIVAVVALCAALFAAFSIVSMAPVLFAELLVDVALAGGLYRHVRGIDRERYWLRTALARTAWRFAIVAALAAAAGWAMQAAHPGAHSLGDVIH
jgi:hypothetical protein